jgi:alkylation response protein AidB-like acyl-CoA dehydrogenase
MDFGLSEDQSLFQEALRGFLSEHCPVDRVRRAIDDGDARPDDLVAGLAAQGVAGILVPEEFGGSGLGLLDAAIAAEELGRAAAPFTGHSAFVCAPVAIASAGDDAQKSEWLPRIASGESIVSFADGAPEIVGGTLNGSVTFVPDAMTAEAFVLVCGAGDATRMVLLPRTTPGLTAEPMVAVDETRRVGELSFDGVQVDASNELSSADATVAIERTLDAGRIALAADALGSVDRTLSDAVEYALQRKQFGRVIGSFQAVKHMCAEVYAAAEPLRALLWYAAFSWDEGYPDAHETALLLKAEATEVATDGVRTSVEVFGGMGFTWECDVHLWFKRAGYDRQVLGGPEELRRAAVAERL